VRGLGSTAVQWHIHCDSLRPEGALDHRAVDAGRVTNLYVTRIDRYTHCRRPPAIFGAIRDLNGEFVPNVLLHMSVPAVDLDGDRSLPHAGVDADEREELPARQFFQSSAPLDSVLVDLAVATSRRERRAGSGQGYHCEDCQEDRSSFRCASLLMVWFPAAGQPGRLHPAPLEGCRFPCRLRPGAWRKEPRCWQASEGRGAKHSAELCGVASRWAWPCAPVSVKVAVSRSVLPSAAAYVRARASRSALLSGAGSARHRA
jgi:hypothetical protein